MLCLCDACIVVDARLAFCGAKETLSRVRAIVKICGWFGLTRVD
jgi:hypothetical protein